MYVCLCEAVTENEVNAEIALGARTIEEIGERCGAGTGCGMCHDRIRSLLPLPTAAGSSVNRATRDDLADRPAKVAVAIGV